MMGLTSDFLTPPLSPLEQVSAFALGAATRGVFVGAVTAVVVSVLPGSHTTFAAPLAILFFGVGAALIMGFVGILTGLWSEKFDHLAAITNFLIMPMTFLSGTFYLVDRLPEPFRTASHFNPFFYLIDGFRYGFIGHADGNLGVGIAMTSLIVVTLAITCWLLFRAGWRLKT
jgi:ABC-2 type transport system permease protein